MDKFHFRYHMKTFDKVATRHYIRSSQMFHTNLVKSPALFFLSKTDPIGAQTSNQRVRESWENMGTQVSLKDYLRTFFTFASTCTRENVGNLLDSCGE